MIGFATDAIAGLTAITPASGIVGPTRALTIDFALISIKTRFGYNDSLDIFEVHDISGIINTVMLTIFAHSFFNGLARLYRVQNKISCKSLTTKRLGFVGCIT